MAKVFLLCLFVVWSFIVFRVGQHYPPVRASSISGVKLPVSAETADEITIIRNDNLVQRRAVRLRQTKNGELVED